MTFSVAHVELEKIISLPFHGQKARACKYAHIFYITTASLLNLFRGEENPSLLVEEILLIMLSVRSGTMLNNYKLNKKF